VVTVSRVSQPKKIIQFKIGIQFGNSKEALVVVVALCELDIQNGARQRHNNLGSHEKSVFISPVPEVSNEVRVFALNFLLFRINSNKTETHQSPLKGWTRLRKWLVQSIAPDMFIPPQQCTVLQTWGHSMVEGKWALKIGMMCVISLEIWGIDI